MQEPPTDTALLQHPQVTSTPHLGASTVDAQTRVAVDIAKQFIAFSRQTALTGAVRIVILYTERYSESNRSFFFKTRNLISFEFRWRCYAAVMRIVCFVNTSVRLSFCNVQNSKLKRSIKTKIGVSVSKGRKNWPASFHFKASRK